MTETSPGNFRIRTNEVLSWFATLGNLGCLPGAPGTYGAAAAALGFCLARPFIGPRGLGLVGLVACLAGVPICQAAAQRFGTKDPSQVIWDEFASVWLLFACLPTHQTRHVWVIVAGLLLHRIFDIYKPTPVAQLEKLPGGWGIMADDCMAALYAWLILRVLLAATASYATATGV